MLRTTFVANLAVALVFAALLPLDGKGQPWTQLWQPALAAVLFIAGQAFPNPQDFGAAKIAIFLASLIAGSIGVLVLVSEKTQT